MARADRGLGADAARRKQHAGGFSHRNHNMLLQSVAVFAKEVRRQERSLIGRRCVSGRDTPDASGAGLAPVAKAGRQRPAFCFERSTPGRALVLSRAGVSSCEDRRARRRVQFHPRCRAFRRAAGASEEAPLATITGSSPKGQALSACSAGTPKGDARSVRKTRRAAEVEPSTRQSKFPKEHPTAAER